MRQPRLRYFVIDFVYLTKPYKALYSLYSTNEHDCFLRIKHYDLIDLTGNIYCRTAGNGNVFTLGNDIARNGALSDDHKIAEAPEVFLSRFATWYIDM